MSDFSAKKTILYNPFKNNYFPKYSKWIFILLFLVLSFIYNYHEILFKSPQSIHTWRQCDCLSITMNYFQDNNSFLQPAVHYLGRDGIGRTVSDFPLIYFSVGQLWKIFGHHEFIFRFLVLSLFFIALFMLFKTMENFLEDSILALVAALLLFTSPTLVYYANNFLMDIPAFSFAIIGLCFFFKFSQSSSNKYLYFSVFFYSIAGLLKISSLLSFAAIIGLFILELFGIKFKQDKKIFQYPRKQFFALIIVLVIQIIWYMYATTYNAKNNAGIFLTGTLPIWDINKSEIYIILDAINEHIKWDYFRKETQLIFVAVFISLLISYKHLQNKTFYYLMIMCSIGFVAFVLLFFQALQNHDYYTINLFILVPIIVFTFLLLIKYKYNQLYNSLFFKVLIILFFIHNVDFARKRIEDRYGYQGWENKNYFKENLPYREISPYLRSIGIKKEDRVICLSDNSINITLYNMNQKGWTNYGIDLDSAKIRDKIQLGAKYILVYEQELYKQESIQCFFKDKIGEYKNISIYNLKNLF